MANGLRVLVVPDPATPVVGVAVHVDVGFRSEPEGRTGSRTSSSTSCSRAARAWRSSRTSGTSRAPAASSTAPPTRTTPTTSRCCPPPRWSGRCSWRPTGCARPTLTEENLRNQVDVVKEEIRLNVLNRPYGGFPWILLPPVLYDTFPNAHNGYGDFSELEQATLDDAAAFFDTYYAPGNAQVTVGGLPGRRRGAAAGREALRRHPGPRRRPIRPSFAEPPPGAERREAVPDAHAPLPALAVGYRLPDPVADLDGYLGHALLGSVLGDGEAARLQRRLVHADGLVTDVSAGAGLMGPLDARDPDTFTVTAVHPAAVDPDRGAQRARRGAGQARRRRARRTRSCSRQVARWSAALYQENDRVMYRMLGLGARELLYGRAEIAAELPERLAAVTPEQVRSPRPRAAAARRARGAACCILRRGGPRRR